MFRLFALLSLAYLSVSGTVTISGRAEVNSILRQHGSASEEIYCYACGLATELGDRPTPEETIRGFEVISPDFERFFNDVRNQVASAVGGFQGKPIPKNRRGPLCTDLLQPFIADVIENVVKGIREGHIETEREINYSDLDLAYEAFQTDLRVGGTPMYSCEL